MVFEFIWNGMIYDWSGFGSRQLQPVKCLRRVGIDGVGEIEIAAGIKLVCGEARPVALTGSARLVVIST